MTNNISDCENHPIFEKEYKYNTKEMIQKINKTQNR